MNIFKNMIILDLAENAKKYAENFSNIRLDILSQLITGAIICPECRSQLTYHSKYSRYPKDGDGTKTHIELIQVKCHRCKKFHSLIPSFLMPYKHYVVEVIETVVSSKGSEWDCNVDNSTIYRWKKQFSERSLSAICRLCLLLMEIYQRNVNIIDFNKPSMFERLALCAEELSSQKHITVIGKVNIILNSADAGFI